MDYKTALHSCIDRITDEVVLKRLYSIVKKAGKATRCAPKHRDRDSHPSDMRDEVLSVMVRNRMAR